MKFKRRSSLGGLILTKKSGDVITFNHGEVQIEIVDVSGKYVRLAIKAPRDVVVLTKKTEDSKDEVDPSEPG